MTEFIENAIVVLKLAIAILPFVLLCIWIRKTNLPRIDRSKQFLMPVIALIYLVIVMLLLDNINTWMVQFVEKIPYWIASLGSKVEDWDWVPGWLSDAQEALTNMLHNAAFYFEKFLSTLRHDVNIYYWIFFLTNAVIALVYVLVIKKIAIKLMSKLVKPDSELYNKVADVFYDYFVETNTRCLKEGYVQMRSFFKMFYVTALVLSVLLTLVMRFLFAKEIVAATFYPVFGIILIGELYFYLDGVTEREFSNHIWGEDEDVYKTVNYSLLRKVLRTMFGDKLLAENTGMNNDFTYGPTADDIISELENSDDPKVVTFASYYGALHRMGKSIDINYLNSSLDMLNGKSILFNNPFYNDLIPYAFYPMNRALLSHQKVLVILGRHAIEDDIKTWLENGIEAVTNIPFMWRIGQLSHREQELDIGIVTRSDVLDIELHNANAEFLEQVGFCVVIEPSKLMSTAQIGLNIIAKHCRNEEDKNVVYCICDKNCDGLVDAMSHALITSITEVSATKKHQGTSSYMCWEADDEYLHHRMLPNISRYLGMGTELSFAALKNQVSKAKWYGGDAFPVADIRWIDKQYYYELTKYAGLPTNQESIDEHFETTSNLWSAKVEKNNYITVEDEDFNMFEVLRDFSTRTTEQGFVNIISSDYILKDYMADNASIFEADAKAIPYIVADYTRSNRNTVLRLILMMSTYKVSEPVLEKEMSLLGMHVYDLKKQIWYELYCCYSDTAQLAQLPDNYEEAVREVSKMTFTCGGREFDISIINIEQTFDFKKGALDTTYSVSDKNFIRLCISDLKSAGYISEDEKGERYYLGAELRGQVYQRYLPGQFFTFGGKYYEMQYLTADGHVLVRRAADHINSRPSYRQMRIYTIHGTRASDKIGAQKNVSGMKIIKEFADFSVNTPGYYKLERYNDLAGGKKILFEGEKNGIPQREYKNKEILRIELPELDGKLNDNVRYTVTLLFNEIFKTLFAENRVFITALTDDSFIENDADKILTYSLDAQGCELHHNSIYIIEDSQLDLGLTVTVERNLDRIFKMVHDYLDWNAEKMDASLAPPPEPEPPVSFDDPDDNKTDDNNDNNDNNDNVDDNADGNTDDNGEADNADGDTVPEDGTSEEEAQTEEKPKKKGFFKKLGEKIKGFFGKFKRKKKDKKNKKTDPEDEPENTEEPITDETLPEEDITPEDENYTEDDGSSEYTDGDEIADDAEEEVETETMASESEAPETAEAPAANGDEEPEEGEEPVGFDNSRKPYHESYYLLFGGETEPGVLDLRATLEYLTALGMDRNPLKQAREGKKIAEQLEATFRVGKPDARYCDFCGAEIFGVEFETLADGRDRCLNCGRTAIKTGEEFRRIFEDVKRNMEAFFDIKINVAVKVEMVNSRILHKKLGKAFVATPDADGRVLGVAIKDKHGYSLLVENGAPRMASILTMAHELTHIWQYVNWKDKAIIKKYGKEMRLEVYEGMAKWAEIQYAYLINEPSVAKREEIITSYRDDEYGRGFLRYRANYPFSTGTVVTKPTPFLNLEEPLSTDFCGTLTVNLPTDHIPMDDPSEKPIEPVTTPKDPSKGPAERDPDGFNRYAYSLLDDSEKAVYNGIFEAINAFEPSFSDFETEMLKDRVQLICDYVQRDHPEIFWFQHGSTVYFDTSTDVVSKVELGYCMTPEEAETRKQRIAEELQPFMDSVKDDMSDFEVTLRIYENIIKLVDYDTIGLERQKATKVDPGTPDDLRSIYGVFVNKKAVCAGYAKATQYLLNTYGIECVYVTSDTHAWNMLKLEGDYYHLDTTWGDGSNTKKEKNTTDKVFYDCFCITTEELLRLEEHKPEPELPLPECTATSCNYHHRYGLYFERYDLDSVRNTVCDRINEASYDVMLKFSPKAYADAKKSLVEESRFREIIQYSNLRSKNRIDGTYSYITSDEKCTMTFYLKKL